jgi:molybdenum cofactor cytidylyltransferase
MRLGAVILAAGAATRMGRIKQLLPFRGLTLVEHAIKQAQQAEFSPIVVVLGAQAEAVAEAVARTRAECVVNENWQSGMGSSISSGVGRILDIAPHLDALALLLADQPFITASHLKQMGHLFTQNSAPILAAKYAGSAGVPALFRNTVFAALKNLPPEAGARALIRGGAADVLEYHLPEAATDIDTPADFAALE